MKIDKMISVIASIPKTIYFNFKYFSFKDAVKMPVLISWNTYLKSCNGEVEIKEPKTFGIKIGFGEVSIFDEKKSRSIWRVEGKVIFNGTAQIGHGSKIAVNKKGTLEFGNEFVISAESSIICREKITFGNNVLLSWETLIMDSDFHSIVDGQEIRLNNDEKIEIGDRVWIGCRCTILKGAKIPDSSIVGAGTTVSKKFFDENTIIGGNTARILKTNINWHA